MRNNRIHFYLCSTSIFQKHTTLTMINLWPMGNNGALVKTFVGPYFPGVTYSQKRQALIQRDWPDRSPGSPHSWGCHPKRVLQVPARWLRGEKPFLQKGPGPCLGASRCSVTSHIHPGMERREPGALLRPGPRAVTELQA